MHKVGQTTVVTSSMTMKWNQAIFVDSFRIILYFGYEPQIRTRIDSMFLSISSWRVNWCDIGFNCHVTALWVPLVLSIIYWSIIMLLIIPWWLGWVMRRSQLVLLLSQFIYHYFWGKWFSTLLETDCVAHSL